MNITTSVTRDPLSVAIAKNVITVVLSLAVICVNSTLVHTFRKHQVFYMNSRYILYIHLVINDIIVLALTILLQGLMYILFTLNVSICIVMLMIAVSSGLNTPLTLAAMAVECHLAVCFPLRHPQICTVRKTYTVISVIWLLSSLTALPDLFVLLAIRPAEYFHSRVTCIWANIFTDPMLVKKKDVSNILCLALVWLILFYSYLRILFAAQTASANAKKARNTVLLHGLQLLLYMLSYLYTIMIQGLSNLFPATAPDIRYVITVLIQILPRLISPMVYGIRDKVFRKHLKQCLFPTRITNIHPEKMKRAGKEADMSKSARFL